MSIEPIKSVLQFLELESGDPPHVTQVKRTTQSKFLFGLVVRHYRRRITPKPSFFTYTRNEANTVKGTIEEHSVFDQDGAFYVLEGFSQEFVEGLHLPPKTYVVAETDGGLEAELFAPRRKRAILKVLTRQLNIHLTLRALVGMDWSSLRSYEDYEVLLRRAKLLEWTEERLAEHLKAVEYGDPLTLTKKSDFVTLFGMMDRLGPERLHRRTAESITEQIMLRAYRTMGYDEARLMKVLELEFWRFQQLEETNRLLTADDLLLMAKRLMTLDPLFARNRSLGLSLYFLNAPIRLRK